MQSADTLAPVPAPGVLVACFLRCAAGLWRGRRSWPAWLLLGFLIATIVLQLVVQYRLNYWNRDFFDAVEHKNGATIWAQALQFVPLAGASVVLAVGSVWGRMTMQRRWRSWLSEQLLDRWLADDRHRQLPYLAGDHQAPEYRIAEDARVATDLPVDLVLGLLSAILVAVTFIQVLWAVGDGLAIEVLDATIVIHGYLVVAVVLYSSAITGATMLIGRRLARVIGESKRAEADLRTVAAGLRERADDSADGDDRWSGRQRVGASLDRVIAHWLALCWQHMRITVVSHADTLLTPVVALLLCTPKYLSGAMSLGEVVQVAAAFIAVQGAFNWFSDNYARIAEWSSSASRVGSLLHALDRLDDRERHAGSRATASAQAAGISAQQRPPDRSRQL